MEPAKPYPPSPRIYKYYDLMMAAFVTVLTDDALGYFSSFANVRGRTIPNAVTPAVVTEVSSPGFSAPCSAFLRARSSCCASSAAREGLPQANRSA